MFTQLSKVCESFLSKAVEYTADNALTNLKDIMDFKPISETLQNNLKSLSAKASDVEEQIKNAELSGRKKRKREIEEWLEEVKSIEKQVGELGSRLESEGFVTRLMNGGTAAKLNEQVEKLVEQSRNFCELVLDICGTSGEILLTNGMVGKTFNENLERILKVLESRQVSSIGVYGMGGVGKTTMAKHIHNRLLQQSQGGVFWITVSQEFTIESLQDKIARSLGVNLLDEDDGDIRAARLHRALSQMKNSVLILDDVWENIDMLKVGCPVSVERCRLIITTRSLEVCRQIHCQEIIPVEILRKDEAWKLFIETLGNGIELSPQVEEIAKSVVKLCGGLPLGVITVAGSMRGETSIHTWKNAFVELKERVVGQDGMGDDEVFKVLKYSFDRLNKNHESQNNEFNTFQLCFLYCSLYPEDHKIEREDLVKKLNSEGLMDQRKSRRAQDHQGHFILDKLVNVCLLENCIDYNGDECVKMHDLVRGMALKICEGKYLVRAGEYSLTEIPDEEEWTKELEKVSLMKSGIRRIGDGISPNCPNISTLLLWGNPLEFIPDSFFSKMQGLCTLDLCRTRITILPDSISDMKSLRALLLEKCEMLEYVPNLGGLKALRELNLSATAIKEAPQGVEELLNLKFLSIDAPNLEMIRSGLLLKLGHLQHVNLPFHIQVPVEEIENLIKLEEFSGRVKNVCDFNCFIRSRVDDTCYRIQVGESHDTTPYRTGGLVLCGCNLKDEKILGQDIVCLNIERCEGMSICFLDLFSRLNNPTSLKRLEISKCGGIEWILRSEQGLPSQIPNTLEYIELVGLEGLKGVIEKGEIGIGASVASAQPVFSSLRYLRIGKCNKMMRKVGLSGVPNLEEINIWECEEMEEIFEDEGRGDVTLPKLKQLYLYNLPRLRKVGLSISRIPNLEGIHIDECGEMEEIFEDEGRGSLTLPNLQQLILIELPRLGKVGLSIFGVPNLEEIRIWGCGKLEEIFEDEGRGSVTLLKLKRLTLDDLPRLRRVCKATMVCNSIERICIREGPRLMKKLPVHLSDPPPPTLIWIYVEREWWESLEWDNPNLPQLLHPLVKFSFEF